MNAADIAQWIAVLRRHPLSVFCAFVCVGCALVSWYIHVNLKWLDFDHRQLGQDADLAVSTLVSGPAVRQELTATRDITRRMEDNLVVPDNLAENLWYFYKIEQHLRLKVALQADPLRDTRIGHLRADWGVPLPDGDRTAACQHHLPLVQAP